MTTTRVYLARHGEVRGAGEVFYGHEDLPLSPRGVAQAGGLSGRLRGTPLDAAYSSDLARTVEFAQIVAGPHQLEVGQLPALREMSLGVLEGLPFLEARVKHSELANRPYESMIDFRMPEGGESLRDVADRALPVYEALIRKHRGEKILIVGHQSVNRILLASALGLPLEGMFSFGQGFGCLSIIDQDDQRARVHLLNEPPDEQSHVVGDRIRVRGIRFEGRHGWFPEERDVPQPFRVDVLIRVPLAKPGVTDDLEDTIDYRDVAEVVVEVGTTTNFRLLEALCKATGQVLLERFPSVLATEVTVYKRVPSLTGEPDEAATSLFVRRGDA